ncbi:MAG: hypothetical protein JWM74_5269 [Myxococcaceae bacterium]|nr:hypothetical protein [Myxococcaceae bacterium]
MTDDTADLFNANVVVHLFKATVTPAGNEDDNCTGTMLTRTRVLTAGHCILGGAGKRPPAWGAQPPIMIGDVRLDSTESVTMASLGSETALGEPINADDERQVARDIAIVALDEEALDRDLSDALDANKHTAGRGGSVAYTFAAWTMVLETHVVRPSFTRPHRGAFVAGWSPQHGALRQVARIADYSLDDGVWSFSEYVLHVALEGGDSGGPFFVTRGDGSRDVFGVHSGVSFSSFTPQKALFADITSSENATWLRDRLVDRSHDGSSQKKWRAMHPVPEGDVRWIGEDEYSGPCEIKQDADCDHWYAEHDNCPALFNHDQRDSDDDGVGDACEE